MVVPPDYHDDQRLLTHKLRVSGCDVDIERSYDTFGNVVLDLSLEHVEREVDVHDAGPSSSARPPSTARTRPTRSRPTSASPTPSRLTRPDDALRAVADELRGGGAAGRRAGRIRSAAASTSTSSTAGA